MRLIVRSCVISLSALGILACTGATSSHSVADRLAGTWSEPQSIPGNSLTMTLASQDTVITGTGTFSYEAGRSGTMMVAGVTSGSTVDLDVSFDYGLVMHFRGSLSAFGTLKGIWYPVPVGDPVSIEFNKVS